MKKYGCHQLDIIIAHPYFDPTISPDESLLPKTCGKTILYYEYDKCDNGKCLKEYDQKAHIMSFQNAFVPIELFDVQSPIIDELKAAASPDGARLFAHNPHCSNSDIFQPLQWSKKYIDVLLLVGDGSRELYPLRSIIYDGIQYGTHDFKIYNYPPPYQLETAKTGSLPKDYSYKDLAVKHHLDSQAKYAKIISSAKICILDSTVTRKTEGKFMDALMSGCVIASDLPFEMEEILKDVIIVLDKSFSPAKINKIIQDALDDPGELKRKAAKGIVLARKHFTCQHKTERMLFLLSEFLNGFRGYYFPYGVRMGCHSYLSPLENVNPWCTAS